MHNYILAAMTLTAQAYFTMLAQRLYSTTLATLEARAEKDALIGELEQAKAISDEARTRAEAANISKSRFLAQMSHELRTPLNAILGFSEVMKSEVFGPHAVPTYKEYAGDIHNSGVHLLNLINEILDLSRIEAGRYELNEEAVDLALVVADCHRLLQLRGHNRGISIHEAFELELPRLWADERACRQICLNLLSNAIKFTPQGGEVWLKVGWTAAGGQYMSVKDNGPGIPEDEIPIVLASFGQGTNAIKSAEQGTGLGLPFGVRERAEARFERRFDFLLERVDLLADRLARVGGDRAHLLEDGGELTLLSEDLRVFVAQEEPDAARAAGAAIRARLAVRQARAVRGRLFTSAPRAHRGAHGKEAAVAD